MHANEFDGLYARLEDLCQKSRGGVIAHSDFLSPRERHYAEKLLVKLGVDFIAFGGFDGAERVRIYVLPDYMGDAASGADIARYGFELGIVALRIRPSGYVKLSHRDYLGAVLGLGLQRSVVGDIIVNKDSTATIVCDEQIGGFLADNLVSVGSDRVGIERIELDSVRRDAPEVLAISDTVASARLDCVIGACLSISREKAKQTVLAGLVEVDFEAEQRPDRVLVAPCMLSVRGHGRFSVISVSDKTRRGRFRLVAEKFL